MQKIIKSLIQEKMRWELAATVARVCDKNLLIYYLSSGTVAGLQMAIDIIKEHTSEMRSKRKGKRK